MREQKEISIINRKNLSSTVKEIMSNKPSKKSNQPYQANLFDSKQKN